MDPTIALALEKAASTLKTIVTLTVIANILIIIGIGIRWIESK